MGGLPPVKLAESPSRAQTMALASGVSLFPPRKMPIFSKEPLVHTALVYGVGVLFGQLVRSMGSRVLFSLPGVLSKGCLPGLVFNMPALRAFLC